VGKPVGSASAVSGEGAAWLAAADNLKLYLECVCPVRNKPCCASGD
jgi:hypothetical protein